jgi:hypothetical protein
VTLTRLTSIATILNPLQVDKLVISQLGLLAQRRLARGVKLNHSEACVHEPHPELRRESTDFMLFLGPHRQQSSGSMHFKPVT